MLEHLRPWLATVASRLPYDTDDLVQEGMIAAWLALGNARSNPESYAKKAAEWRMKDLALARGATFGAERRGYGGALNPEPIEVDDSCVGVQQPVDSDLVYHYNEICGAVVELTPNEQKYVHLRFWEGMNTSELNTAFGYVASPIWTKAKSKLKVKLAHLKGAV